MLIILLSVKCFLRLAFKPVNIVSCHKKFFFTYHVIRLSIFFCVPFESYALLRKVSSDFKAIQISICLILFMVRGRALALFSDE